ncbi:2-dehydro-3-deoxy-D-gluconate 5-dehydrogenase KduD [Sphingomonas aracearum]|uniref:2-dehydro-3-deoxy-D-gluconate 5-dehydrogenase n=1 Tax=Sphingomonas aracearum TaxID=2283317 RepID=A0A369W1M0_9SPHN|nr:2-dehydro-3-deoxy-D-gluconate 5-dehydrogenase KduD [Sphingomonas aracearum]RDE07172.1 2-deoxy-D-gluconate 3-dehydrogenase [Sphingomonas aracearum]
MTTPFDLTGRRALVTGANTGIGQAIAVALAGAGADVAVAGRSEPAETRTLVEATGRKFVSIKADLSSTAPVEEVVATTVAELGGIDILVNNAGIIRRADSVEFSEADWDAVMDTNLKTLFFLTQAAAKHMLAQGRGKVVNIASLLSFQGGIRVPSYTAAKHGVSGITKILANEWAAKGVNVNAIAPGYIETNNTEALRADADRSKAILDRIPAGRWGDPKDIAGTAVFLASPAADYIHGVTLPVDGGWLAR